MEPTSDDTVRRFEGPVRQTPVPRWRRLGVPLAICLMAFFVLGIAAARGDSSGLLAGAVFGLIGGLALWRTMRRS